MGSSLVEALDAEEYAPVTMQDLIDYAVDQDTPWGTFTRLGSSVAFSHTPSMFMRPSSWPDSHPDTIVWTDITSATLYTRRHIIPRNWRVKVASETSFPATASKIAATAAAVSVWLRSR
jgi:hypothetical protein